MNCFLLLWTIAVDLVTVMGIVCMYVCMYVCGSIFGQSIAPVGMAAWNPSFDVTPSSLITGVITELGVVEFDPVLGTDMAVCMYACIYVCRSL